MKRKTLRALKKRVKVTGKGKFLRYRAGKSHLLSGKKRSRKRKLSKPVVTKKSESKRLKRLLPYN